MSSKLLPCMFKPEILCSFRKTMKFVVMHRCMKCRFYREFMREMEEEDQEIMDEIDREMAEAERRGELRG